MAGSHWQVRLRDGWTDVAPEDEAFIESAWAGKELSLRYSARRQNYEVDYQRMLQRDARGRERPLRRTAAATSTGGYGGAASQGTSVGADVAAVRAEMEELDSAVRAEVRAETSRRVLGRLGVLACDLRAVEAELATANPDKALRKDLSQVRLFRDIGSGTQRKAEDPRALLPRFEVLACPCAMEFGEAWAPLPPSSVNARFWVHHVAALNIGESGHASDFSAYRTATGDLDEAGYLLDMRRVFANLFEAQARSGAEHSVLVPIGMGAFLRHLALNDPAYALPDCIALLRQRIAQQLVSAAYAHVVSATRQLRLHICVQSGEEGGEAMQNKEALTMAFHERGLGSSQVNICEDKDATVLATELAQKWWQEKGALSCQHDGEACSATVAPVSLANAANARLLGNHWFAGGAQRAVDENIHRRAPLLAAISLLLNGGTSARFRQPDELAQRLVELGGDVDTLASGIVTV